MSGDKVTSAVNQQETLYYFSGFLAGEGSISIIRATNKKGGTGFYFTPDITVSNSDLKLLKDFNRTIAKNIGVISSIKGGYNLSFRGREKVKTVLNFLKDYPLISGDLVNEKLLLLKKAIAILSKKGNSNRRFLKEEEKIEKLRDKLRKIKITAKVSKSFPLKRANREKMGFFLAGIVDAEGSMGVRKCGKRLQPYFCVLMREGKIIKLLKKFFGFGNLYYRPAEKLFHFETAKRENILKLCDTFLRKYPLKLLKNRNKLENLQRSLNDHTHNPD